jgi:hypothetical protein
MRGRSSSWNHFLPAIGKNEDRSGSCGLGQGADPVLPQARGDEAGNARFPPGAVHVNAEGNLTEPSLMEDSFPDEISKDDGKDKEIEHGESGEEFLFPLFSSCMPHRFISRKKKLGNLRHGQFIGGKSLG